MPYATCMCLYKTLILFLSKAQVYVIFNFYIAHTLKYFYIYWLQLYDRSAAVLSVQLFLLPQCVPQSSHLLIPFMMSHHKMQKLIHGLFHQLFLYPSSKPNFNFDVLHSVLLSLIKSTCTSSTHLFLT